MGCKSLSFRWALVLMRLSGAVGKGIYYEEFYRGRCPLSTLITHYGIYYRPPVV